jgi:hypothetical protein
MPRVSKSARYAAEKKSALNQLNKVELTEKLAEAKSNLHEVQDLMTVEKNNLGEHNPKDIQHKSARFGELKQIRDTITNDVTQINSQLEKIKNPDSILEKKSVLNAGISIRDNPMLEDRPATAPITAEGDVQGWSISGNPDFLTGEKQFSFDGDDDKEILRRRQGRSNTIADIVDPMRKPRLQVAGREQRELTREEYNAYEEEKFRVLHNEGLVARQIQNDRLAEQRGLSPIQYAHAESQGSNPVREAVSLIDQSSRGLEGISEDGVRYQNFGGAFDRNREQTKVAFNSNYTKSIITPENNLLMQHLGSTDSPINQVAQGSKNVIGSYANLVGNVGNMVQGKPTTELKEENTPVIDSLFGAVQTGIADSHSYNVPFTVSMSDSWDNFLKTQAQRSPYTIAGEIATEAAILAIPIPATKALSAAKFGFTRFFGRNEIKAVAEVINPFKASTKNPKALEKTKNASESILLQGSESSGTYFPANVIKSSGRGKKKNNFGHTTSYSDTDIIKSIGLTHLKEIRLLGKPEKQLQKDLGLKKVKKDYYTNENPDVNQLHQFGMATETKQIRPVTVGRKYSNVEIMKYKKSFSQFYTNPTDAAVTKPISDTAIYVTKDYGLTRNPILNLNYYLKSVIPKSQKTNKVNKKSFDQAPENKSNSQTIELPKANKVTTKQKEIKNVVRKVSDYDNQKSFAPQSIFSIAATAPAFLKGITNSPSKVNTELTVQPQIQNVGLGDVIGFESVVNLSSLNALSSKLAEQTKQVTQPILSTDLLTTPKIQSGKIQNTFALVAPIKQIHSPKPFSTVRPAAFIPFLWSQEERRKSRRKRKGKVMRKKATWHTPDQTPFKVLAGSGNYQYWGSKSDSKQLGRGWY